MDKPNYLAMLRAATRENNLNSDAAEHAMSMTLRDYFAAKALQALIEVYEPDAMPGCVPACGRDAYKYADAMLEARKNEIRNP